MYKRVLSLMLLAALCVGGNVFAQVEYIVDSVEGMWNDVAFWGGAASPMAADRVILKNSSAVTIDGTAEQCSQLEIASYSSGPDLPCSLNIINGGSLEVLVGATYTGWTYIANRPDDVGIVTVGAGSTYRTFGPLNVGYKGKGTLVVDGGTVEANGGLYVPNPWTSGDGVGTVNLLAGSITANEISMKDTGYIDIAAGTLTIQGAWWASDADFLGYINNKQIVAYGGTGTLDVQVVGGNTVVKAIHQYQPNPANGGTAGAGAYQMTWLLPDPNDDGGVVTCDVYVSDTFEGMSVSMGDPNFPDYAAKEVDGQSVESVTVTLETLKNYYWRIDIHDTSANEVIIGPIFTFDTMNTAPTVDLGDDVPTWLVDGTAVVNLTGIVGHDGLPGPDYTVEWEVLSEPVAGAAAITPDGVDPLKISVSLTELGDYVIRLTADDSLLEGFGTVMISVYSDNCEAAKMSGVELLEGDINADCVVDMADVAAMAANWLKSMAL